MVRGSRLAARPLAALLATALLLATGLAAGPAAANQLGTYKGNGTTGRNHIPEFEAWLGREIPRALDFVAIGNSWSSVISDAIYVAHSWDGGRWKLTISLPMLPADGHSTLQQGAKGAYNSYFKQIAGTLVAHGLGASVIRMGWEFNGNWFPWAANKCPSCFVQFWRQIVTTMRAVPGAQFHFDWCADLGYNSIASDTVYPGDAYVDLIGLDVYNQSWNRSITTPQARWANLVNQSFGLKWQANFAGAHHKWISFPEWATGIWSNAPGVGGGDDPYFIQQMYNWMSGHSVGYHNYFDIQGTFRSALSNNQYPKAGALFRRLFGPGT
jgi:hypothetical protein